MPTPQRTPRSDARPTAGPARPGRQGTWHRAMTSPAVPALAATAVVGLAAGALWGHSSLASQAGPLPTPAPTVTLVRTVPVPARATPSTSARAVARTTSAGVASPRVAPATRAVVRQVRSEPRRAAPAKGAGHHEDKRTPENGKSGGKKADGHHGGKGDKEDHHHPAGGRDGGKQQTRRTDRPHPDHQREHATAPQRSHRS